MKHLAVLSSLFALLAAVFIPELRVNASDSVDVRLLRVASDVPIERGDFVAYCLPGEWTEPLVARGYPAGQAGCDDESIGLLKRVVALEGEELRDLGPVLEIENGPRLARLPGFPVATLPAIVPDGFAVLAGEHPRSYDSRYFGLVPTAELERLEALW